MKENGGRMMATSEQLSFFADTTLDDARATFLEEIQNAQGTTCPVCGRFGKMYVRPFNRGMARTLIWLYLHARTDYAHMPTTAPRSILTDNQVGKLAFWGMAKAKPNVDDPGKNKLGWWMATKRGIDFIEGSVTANSHVIEFNHQIFGWRDKQITMSDALGEPFDYRKLMEDSPP